MQRTVFAFVVLAAAPAVAKPTSWTIDPAHSSAGFIVRHMMVSNVHGEFGKVAGTITFDADNPAQSKVDATVDVSTINTHEEKRDGHLKSPDFFDVAKFPTMTFKSKKIWKEGAGYKMTGDLTMHGVTKEVTFDVTGPTKPIKSPFGDVRAGATAAARVNRYDWGLKWNKAVEGGDLVGQDVVIGLDVELVEKKPEQAKK